jgi:ribosomal protein S18 acetylase RimI-like enzyme
MMNVFIFRDRQGRVINLLLNDNDGAVAAYHKDTLVGTLELDCLDGVLLDIAVSPHYRKSGIAHTMIARVHDDLGRPLGVRRPNSADAAFSGLVQNLTHEGLVKLLG